MKAHKVDMVLSEDGALILQGLPLNGFKGVEQRNACSAKVAHIAGN